MPVPDSKPIPLIKAKAEIQQRKKLWDIVVAQKASLATIYPDKVVGERFYGHQGNAFLFDKHAVLRHFFVDGDPTKGSDNTHLLVVVASHDIKETPFEQGDPTIIIAGVKENTNRLADQDPTEYEFIASNITDPADEYPPVMTIDEIHNLAKNDTSFYIKII